MLDHSAELSFRKGLDLVDARGYRDALSFFSGAIEIDRTAKHGGPIEPRYLSYYGLCLCMARVSKRKALEHCRAAIKREPYNADFWANLGRVALVVGRREEAYQAFKRGLTVEPDHRGILQNMKRMGVRRPPVLTFLARENPLNVMLGRARNVSGKNRHNGHVKSRSKATESVTLRNEAVC